MKPDERRVVVTGLGVVSSIGIGWQDFWKNCLAGRSGISRVEAFDTSRYERHYAGEVKGFDAGGFMPKRKASRMGRASQLGVAASLLALDDAKLTVDKIQPRRMGVFIGTTTGEIGLLEQYNDKVISDRRRFRDYLHVALFPSSSISSFIAKEFGLKGQNCVFGTACASGNYALAQAFDLIRSGDLDCALVGGADGFSRIVFTGFGRLFAVAPEKCQPFDKNRQGMIPAEGAGILVVESLESARNRKADIYAEVLGYGMSCDARHMTAPSVEGICHSLTGAITHSGIRPDDVDYISAHGTGTKENDLAESRAINRVFGKKTRDIPVSSIKSMIGHTMGAAAALESVVCCLAIRDQRVPPTINVEEQDRECEIDCVPNTSRERKVKTVINNSLAFGGNNGALVLKRH